MTNVYVSMLLHLHRLDWGLDKIEIAQRLALNAKYHALSYRFFSFSFKAQIQMNEKWMNERGKILFRNRLNEL